MNVVSFPYTKKLSLLVILLVTAGVYFNTLFNGYAIDDYYVTALNPDIKKGIAGIPDIFTSYYGTDNNGNGFEYRPLVKVTYAIEYELFGENLVVSHLVNLLLYLVNIGLLFILLTKLFDWKKIVYLYFYQPYYLHYYPYIVR
ncbi:MAG: hypothetical protein M0D57_06420 [Sphingobacteriales bacterium JAD_PAG50586_3]|nr:MAG: hypothetical protein M0D57_06420 [Sphingobacteriales bacterium JAD_PAG50586_3]